MGKVILKKITAFLLITILVMMSADVNQQTSVYAKENTSFFKNAKYVSISEAADYAREEMLKHEPSITVYIKSASNNPEEVFYDFNEEVLKETDNGDEGDYMRWDIDSQYPYYSYRPVKSGKTTYYYYDFIVSTEYFTTIEQKKQVDEKVQEILQSFAFTETTTDYEKIKTIYDYVCNNVTYSEDVTKDIVYTSWSALYNGEAVCQGYAQLIYRMLKEVGVSARVIPGYGLNTDIKHGWNIVKIGDFYYNMDATWDSQNVQEGNLYEYFLKGDNFKNHTRLDTFNTAEFYAGHPMSSTDYGVTENPVASDTSLKSAFSIIKPKFKKVTRKKIKLVKVAGAYKYQIKYSVKKNFKKGTITKNTKKTIYKLKKLKKKKAYYVKFRAYRYINKMKTYTQWSNVKRIKKK